MVTGFGSDTDYGRAVAIQPDGKIVVAGDGKNERNNYALGAVRLLSNGSLDTSFSADGKTTTWVGSGTNFGNAALIQADGKIVVAGLGFNGTNNDFALVRYNGDGGLDCSQCIDTGNLANIYNRAVGADRLWNAPGYLRGQGVTVAVVDSGFADNADFSVYGGGSSRILAAANLATGSTGTTDGYGHGTHVGGVIAGNGNQSNGMRTGIAPGANLINVKVANDQGMSYASDLVAGLEWIYNNRTAYNIKVVNISMNSAVPESYHTSPIDAAVEILWFNGIVVVVSAGNNGGPGSIFPPANDPFVITVGAADDAGTAALTDDVVASFSAYGITEDGFSKPDLIAPGRNIQSLLASTSARVYTDHPANRVDTYLFRMSGTSMSAGIVSGAAALLLQDEPDLNPDQVKYRLMATANNGWTCANNQCRVFEEGSYGAGYLDAYAAVNGTTTQTANTGTTVSQLLTMSSTGVDELWGTAQWGSAQWGSAQWGSAQWGSAQWGSAQWGSDYWGP